ncbi:S-methyl-5-thioribose-1-phosphate isomerase [Calditrichota bacterium GD2]
MNIETIRFKNNRLLILDQTLLPHKQEYRTLKDLSQVIEAIKSLRVRGAPAIGIVAAYGLAIHALNLKALKKPDFEALKNAAQQLKQARPTAVNLKWAIDRQMAVIENLQHNEDTMVSALIHEAKAIHDEDRETCDKIGSYGDALIADGFNILTHCNTGFLATGGIGTALGVVYKAAENHKNVHVFVDETRPVGQGARLTFWELNQAGIPATLITDNMAGSLMKEGKVDIVITGADRIAANGDTANKIGTYSLAVLAKAHNIPFYIAAPYSTFDLNIDSGQQIPIEQRPKEEVLQFWNIPSKDSYQVYNPAFDVTPGDLINGIITEFGIIKKPFEKNIINVPKQFNKGDAT